jgi:hypothetical protein
MRCLKGVVLFIFWLSFNSLGVGQDFKLVKAIGDEREHYTLFKISGAVLTADREIIISDLKGNFVVKYDWQGKFLKRIGQKGKGPGDFMGPSRLDLFENKIYLLDHSNARFVEMDQDLENLKYFKPAATILFKEHFRVIDHHTFIATSFLNFSHPEVKGIGKVLIIDKYSGIKRAFFDFYPIDIGADYGGNKDRALRLDTFGEIVWALDDKRERMLISFSDPDNPIAFYVFNIKGERLHQFEYRLDKRFRFPYKLINLGHLSLESLKGLHIANIRSIFYFDKHWFVFMETNDYRSAKDADRNFFYLRFDEDGTDAVRIPLEHGFIAYYVSGDGYVLGRRPYSEIEKLFIYRMNN